MKKIFYILSALILTAFFIPACGDNKGSTIIGNTDPTKITISKLSDAGTATITIPIAIFGSSARDVQGATIDVSINGVATITGLVAADHYLLANEIVTFIVSNLHDGDELTFTIHLADGTSVVYSGIVSIRVATDAGSGWMDLYSRAGSTTFAFGLGIAVDASGNSYVTGNTGDFNGGDAFVTKYNFSGTKQWTKFLDISGKSTTATGIVVDSDGNSCIVGRTVDSLTNNYTFIAQYDPSGSKQWEDTLHVANAVTNSFRRLWSLCYDGV